MKLEKVYILVCRGIGETPGDGTMLVRFLRKALPANKFQIDEIPWPASYGPVPRLDGLDYGESLEVGMGMIYEALRELPPNSRAFLVGFSAGATLAGNWAAHGRTWVAEHAGPQANANMWRLLGVGLVSDPMRPEGGGCEFYTAPGFGVGGARPVPAYPANPFKTWWLSDPADMICSLERHSPIRTIADQTYAMSFAPGEFPEWIGDLLDRVKKRRWQPVEIPWWNLAAVRDQYQRALHDLLGYLQRGDHVQYGVRHVPGHSFTYLEALAKLIRAEVEDFDPSYLAAVKA